MSYYMYNGIMNKFKHLACLIHSEKNVLISLIRNGSSGYDTLREITVTPCSFVQNEHTSRMHYTRIFTSIVISIDAGRQADR